MSDAKKSVLIVEDEPKLAELLGEYLSAANFDSHWIAHGEHVIDWVRLQDPDLILLDVMLPGRDGLSICRELRSFSAVPVIMITARVEEIDRLLGLELGADDYVCKPFSPREVILRVRAVMRRSIANREQASPYRGLNIDTDRFRATINGTELELTPVEFRLLAQLAEQPGRVYSRAQLMSQIYTDDRIVSDRTIDSHVKNLRQKLELACDEDIVRSIYGVGYKLE
ncbi:MAG: response regulator [Pseudomonadota bacterium]